MRGTVTTTNHALEGGSWIPRDDMAALAKVSVDTIRRDERRLNSIRGREASPTDEAGRVLVNVGEFLSIGRICESDLHIAATPAESALVIRARKVELDLSTEVARLQGERDQLERAVSALEGQLKAHTRPETTHPA